MRKRFIQFLKKYKLEFNKDKKVDFKRGYRAEFGGFYEDDYSFILEEKRKIELEEIIEDEKKSKECSDNEKITILGTFQNIDEFKNAQSGDIIFQDSNGYFTGIRVENIPTPPQIPIKKVLETPFEENEFLETLKKVKEGKNIIFPLVPKKESVGNTFRRKIIRRELMKKELRVLETFAGIGAPRKALMRGGYNYKIVDSIEIDPNPIKSYNAIYNDNIIPQDISKWNKIKEEIGEIDLIWNSSPCQDFSIAGTNKSGEKDSGTRSSLVYEIIRITKEFMPKYIVWENVKGLTTKKHKHILEDYILSLEELGYNSQWQVLNSKDYGIPQSRERVFVVSIRNDLDVNFEFPLKQKLELSWRNFENYDRNELLKAKPNKTPSREKMKLKCKNITNENYCYTITLKQDRWPNAGIIEFEDYYRFLTPREQWRLMGFDNSDFERAKEVNDKKSMLEKQARKQCCRKCNRSNI